MPAVNPAQVILAERQQTKVRPIALAVAKSRPHWDRVHLLHLLRLVGMVANLPLHRMKKTRSRFKGRL
jgi:hypothetical protein